MEKELLIKKAYSAIFDTSPESILIIDTKGNIIDINSAFQKWAGYEKDQMVGKNILNMPYLTQKTRLKAMGQLVKRITGKKIDPYILDFVNKAGEKKKGLINAKLLKDENGKVYADLVLISDVTELSLKIEELERMNRMMEHREARVSDLREKMTKLKAKKGSE